MQKLNTPAPIIHLSTFYFPFSHAAPPVPPCVSFRTRRRRREESVYRLAPALVPGGFVFDSLAFMSFPRRRESSFLSDLSYLSDGSESSDFAPSFPNLSAVHPPCCVAGLPASGWFIRLWRRVESTLFSPGTCAGGFYFFDPLRLFYCSPVLGHRPPPALDSRPTTLDSTPAAAPAAGGVVSPPIYSAGFTG